MCQNMYFISANAQLQPQYTVVATLYSFLILCGSRSRCDWHNESVSLLWYVSIYSWISNNMYLIYLVMWSKLSKISLLIAYLFICCRLQYTVFHTSHVYILRYYILVHFSIFAPWQCKVSIFNVWLQNELVIN